MVRIDRRDPGTSSTLRPDLVVTHGRNITMVDVTVPFENGPEALRAAAESKITKYAPLASELRAQGFKVDILPFVVGSLGTRTRGNEEALAKLEVGVGYRRLMWRLVVSETLGWSRDIYIEHVTGHRQYYRPPPRADSYLAATV